MNKYIKQLVFVCDIYVFHGMRARGLVLRVLVYVAIFSVMTKNTHVSAYVAVVYAVDALIKAFGPYNRSRKEANITGYLGVQKLFAWNA